MSPPDSLRQDLAKYLELARQFASQFAMTSNVLLYAIPLPSKFVWLLECDLSRFLIDNRLSCTLGVSAMITDEM